MTTWHVRARGTDGERPLVVEAEPGTTRGELVDVLRRQGWPADTVYVGGERWAADDEQPLAGELHHGACLTTEPAGDPPLAPGTYLVVIAGPDAGSHVRLAAGAPLAVGRACGDAGWTLPGDPLLSAAHCEFRVADGAVTVRDLGSRNGTVCDGELVAGDPHPLGTDAVVHIGSTVLRIVAFDGSDRAITTGRVATGRTLQRQFREARAELAPPPRAPRPPVNPDPEGATGVVLRALAPVAAAVGMALYTGRWWFLAIGLLSPVVYGADAFRRTRRRRNEQRMAAERHTTELARHAARVADFRRAETRRARARHPGGALAALAARFGHRRIWERRPDDDDFGWVTLGSAALASAYQDDDASTTARLWHMPLSIDLAVEGPLGIVGPHDRARAVARALVIDLVSAHAPGDVRVWVLGHRASEPAWAFARWLPHVFTPGGGARLATTPDGAATLLHSLRGEITARAEVNTAARTRALPLHVVIVDGTDAIPAADLAELLGDGPRHGIVSIVVDQAVVPEGVRGELRLGAHADRCTYRSVCTPPVGALAVAELPIADAEAAACSLAPLESLGGTDRHAGLAPVHLTDLVALGERTAVEQAAFWRAVSPCTDVPVGVTRDGTPWHLDLVRHGPHGLVGGMTRSGKTEFLKSWFAALALHNHPDDLAIVIVDFKGGVDHQAVADLPHVIALATNQDIDLFERTVTLLTAELERRQRVFTDDARVATLEGYRTARRLRPELPPMPRLLVVVDEFAELLDSPEGRAELGRLESTSRIGAGLGVHLVLLTQMFDHALPATIDGQAGLRVCFKVQHAEHSKVVLGSPAAVAIPAAAKGRALVRVQGGEVTEFQVARVGNAAPGARGTPVPHTPRVVVRDAPTGTLALPVAAPEAPEVPSDLQDLHRVVTLVRAAAELGGPSTPVVPWPGELPRTVAPADLASTPDEVPIGLADDPHHQCVVTVCHRFTDDVVLYAGASGSGHHDALVATAAQLIRHTDPADVHVYGIDLVGHGLARLEGAPHVGAIATRDEATALRMLSHLIADAAARKASRAANARTVLFVLGLERVFLHAESASSPLLGPLTTLVNEVPGTGIQVVCSGAPTTATNRIGAAAGRRLIFASHDPADYPPGLPRAMRARLGAAGRCVDLSTGLLTQIVAAGALDDVTTGRAEPPGERAPRRFTRSPWPLQLTDVGTPTVLRAACDGRVPLGVRPESGELVWLDPDEDGCAHRIVGPPKSGRSDALAAIAILAAACGWDVVVSCASRRSPLHRDPRLARRIVPVGELPDWIGERVVRPTVVVVDDAHRLDDDYPWRKLATVETAPVVTFVGGATDGLARPLGVARTLGAAGGVALMPTRPRDADSLGARTLDDVWLVQPLPGIGVAVIAGEAQRIQFPLVVDQGAGS